MTFVDVYITTKNIREARKIANILVKEKLAACVNIIPSINSVYRWKGKIVKEKESALIAKTRKSNVKEIIARVKNVHSYSVPCIVAVPILDGNKDYLKWIKKETKK